MTEQITWHMTVTIQCENVWQFVTYNKRRKYRPTISLKNYSFGPFKNVHIFNFFKHFLFFGITHHSLNLS